MTIPLKTWVHEEAARCGATPVAIYNRLYKGKYPGLPLRRINPRLVLVEINGDPEACNDWMGEGAYQENFAK